MSESPARVRVLDLADESGVFAGRVLADLGCDVVRVEPPDGGRVRRRSPFRGGEPGIEQSLYHLYHNANKRSVTLDLTTPAGAEAFRSLARTADAVIETATPGQMSSLGLGYESLRELNPALTYVAITPFGQDGPRSGWAGSDLIAAAAGGLLYVSGDPAGPPTLAPGEQSYVMAGLVAATGVLIAHAGRLGGASPVGSFLDVSVQEAVSMAVLQTANANFYRLDGRIPGRPGIHPPIYQCADGRWVGLRVRPDRFPQVLDWARAAGALPADATLELESLQRSSDTGDINSNEAVAEMISTLARAHPADEFLTKAWSIDLIGLPVSRLEEMAELPHFRDTGQFLEVPQASGEPLSFPLSPVHDWNQPTPVRRAPLLGEHTDEVLGALDLGPSLREALGLAAGGSR